MKKTSLVKISRVLDGGGLVICLFLLLVKRIHAYSVYRSAKPNTQGVRWDVIFYQFLRCCLQSGKFSITANVLKFTGVMSELVLSLTNSNISDKNFNAHLLNFFSTMHTTPSSNFILVRAVFRDRPLVVNQPTGLGLSSSSFKPSFIFPNGGISGVGVSRRCETAARQVQPLRVNLFTTRSFVSSVGVYPIYYTVSKATTGLNILRYSFLINTPPRRIDSPSFVNTFSSFVLLGRGGLLRTLRLGGYRRKRPNRRRRVKQVCLKLFYFWRLASVFNLWSRGFGFRVGLSQLSGRKKEALVERIFQFSTRFGLFFKAPRCYVTTSKGRIKPTRAVRRIRQLRAELALKKLFFKKKVSKKKHYRKARKARFSGIRKFGSDFSIGFSLVNKSVGGAMNSIAVSSVAKECFNSRIFITTPTFNGCAGPVRFFSTQGGSVLGEFLTTCDSEGGAASTGDLLGWVLTADTLNLKPLASKSNNVPVVKQGYFLRRGAVGFRWSPAFGVGFSHHFDRLPTKLLVPGVTSTILGGIRSERTMTLAQRLLGQSVCLNTRVNRDIGGSVLAFTNSFFFKRGVKWNVLRTRKVFLPKMRLMYYTFRRHLKKRFSFRNSRRRRQVQIGLPPRAKLRRKKLRYHTYVTSCLKEVMFSKRRLTTRLVFLKRNLHLIRTSKRLLSRFFFKKRHVPSWFFWLKRRRFHFYWKIFRKRKPQKSRQARSNVRRQLRVFKTMWRNWSVTKQKMAYSALFFNIAHKPTIVSYWYRRTLRRRRRFKGFSQRIRRLYRRLSVRLVSSLWLRKNGFVRLNKTITKNEFFSTAYIPWVQSQFAWTGLFFARGLLRFKFGKSGRRLLTLRPISQTVAQNRSLLKVNFNF